MIENKNIISELTEKKITSIEFGSSIKELEFDVQEWNRHYGENRSDKIKEKENFFRHECNKERIKNGLNPI